MSSDIAAQYCDLLALSFEIIEMPAPMDCQYAIHFGLMAVFILSVLCANGVTAQIDTLGINRVQVREKSVNASCIVSKLLCVGAISLIVSSFQSVASDDIPSTVHNLTLKQAIDWALENNREINDRRALREIERLGTSEDKRRFKPNLGFSSTVQDKRGPGTSDRFATITPGFDIEVPTGGKFTAKWSRYFGEKSLDTGSQTFTFTQPIPLLIGAWNDIVPNPVRNAQINVRESLRTNRKTVEGVVESVVPQYQALIRARLQVEKSQAALDSALKQLETTRTLISVGRVAEREILQSEASITNREIALIAAREALDSANDALIKTLNLNTADKITPIDALTIEPISGELAPSLEEVLDNQADYEKAQIDVEKARRALAKAQNNQLPKVDLVLETTRARSGSDTLPSTNTSSISATLTIKDLLKDRVGKRELLMASDRLRKAERDLILKRDEIERALQRAVNGVERQSRSIQLAQRARELAADNLQIERNKFTLGLSSASDVTASEDSLEDAEEAEREAEINYFTALLELDKTTGRTLERWGIVLEDVIQ